MSLTSRWKKSNEEKLASGARSSKETLLTQLKYIQELIERQDCLQALDLSRKLVERYPQNQFVSETYAKALWGLQRRREALNYLEWLWNAQRNNEYLLRALCRMHASTQDDLGWIAFSLNIDFERVRDPSILALCGRLFHNYGYVQQRDRIITRIGQLPLAFGSASFVADVLLSLGRRVEGERLVAKMRTELALGPEQCLHLLGLAVEYGLPIEEPLLAAKRALQTPGVSESTAYAAFAIRHFRDKAEPGPSDKRFLFVSGAPRSGTSALGHLLGVSGQIGVFVERFSHRYGYHPAMFRLQHLASGDYQTHRHRLRWVSLVRHYSSLRYIGDKRPHFLKSWSITSQNFDPGRTRIVHIHRDIQAVARSYDTRAYRASIGADTWTSRRDYRAACADWNLSNQLLLKALEREEWRSSFLVVRYRDVFGSLESAARIFDWLGVELTTAEQADLRNFMDGSRLILEKPSSLDPAKATYLGDHIDRRSANEVDALCAKLD